MKYLCPKCKAASMAEEEITAGEAGTLKLLGKKTTQLVCTSLSCGHEVSSAVDLTPWPVNGGNNSIPPQKRNFILANEKRAMAGKRRAIDIDTACWPLFDTGKKNYEVREGLRMCQASVSRSRMRWRKEKGVEVPNAPVPLIEQIGKLKLSEFLAYPEKAQEGLKMFMEAMKTGLSNLC